MLGLRYNENDQGIVNSQGVVKYCRHKYLKRVYITVYYYRVIKLSMPVSRMVGSATVWIVRGTLATLYKTFTLHFPKHPCISSHAMVGMIAKTQAKSHWGLWQMLRYKSEAVLKEQEQVWWPLHYFREIWYWATKHWGTTSMVVVPKLSGLKPTNCHMPTEAWTFLSVCLIGGFISAIKCQLPML